MTQRTLFEPTHKDGIPGFDYALIDGEGAQTSEDQQRLKGQMLRIYKYMQTVGWQTLEQIGQACHAPEASVSAQLRHLRKRKFGAHTIERRNKGGGLWEYRLKKVDTT